MHFPDLLGPQNKRKVKLQVAGGHFFFLNRPSIVSEQKVRGDGIMGGNSILGVQKPVVLGLKNTPFFTILGI